MSYRQSVSCNAPQQARKAHGGILQRKCACGQHAGGEECEKCRGKRQLLQRQPANVAEPAAVPPIVHESLRSPGHPLDGFTRTFMESRFRHDFGQVRVHTDAPAAESARAVGALAYTVGPHVVFGAGRYAPSTLAGRRLLAHELGHVIQQRGARNHSSKAMTVLPADGPTEREAEKAADAVTSGRHAEILGHASQGLALQPETRATEEQTAEAGLLALGHALGSAGRDIGVLRDLYNRGEQAIAQEIARMRAAGVPLDEIARRAAVMRTANALDVRRTSGALLSKAAELFDRVRGSAARPTYESLRATGRTDAQIIESALRTNRFINRLPSGLRWAGRGAWVVQGAIAVFVVVSTPEEGRARAAAEEGGGFVGGLAGTAAVGALCVATGIATGGAALIVCGILGGILGAATGRAAGGALYEQPQLLLGPAVLPLAMPTIGMGAGGGFRGFMERDRQRMLETMRGGR
jgi:uncharacterized protein DUF4157